MVIPLPYGPFHFKRISGEINKQKKKKKKNPFFPSLLFSFSFLERRRLWQEEHGIYSYTFLSSVCSNPCGTTSKKRELRDSDQPDKKESKQARNPGNFSAGQQYKEKRGVVVVGCSGYKTAQQLLLLYSVPNSTT